VPSTPCCRSPVRQHSSSSRSNSTTLNDCLTYYQLTTLNDCVRTIKQVGAGRCVHVNMCTVSETVPLKAQKLCPNGCIAVTTSRLCIHTIYGVRLP
jgi:hypothetical protein